MLQLNTIKAHPGAVQKRKRLGRGSGSGLGATAGKGDKGQLARSGGSVRPGFEGGQMPLYRRIPKRGFKNFMRRDTAVLNVGDLEKLDASQFQEISLESLQAANVIKGRHERLVILGTGELKRSWSVKAHKISPSAQEKITKAGGKTEVVVIAEPKGKKQKRAEKAE
jgi:large subunit ribosomal protein L15